MFYVLTSTPFKTPSLPIFMNQIGWEHSSETEDTSQTCSVASE